MVEGKRRAVSVSRSSTDSCHETARSSGGCVMKFALVNPAWNFKGSTYFGCQDPHYPLELLFAFDKIHEAGHEPLVIDAQLEELSPNDVKRRLGNFNPDFLVIPT